MKNYFIEITNNYPYLSSAIKVLILGTFGEYLALFINSKYKFKCISIYSLFSKMLIWAILGIIIKWIFSSFAILVKSQVEHNLLPSIFKSGFFFALAVSLQLNLLFTPFLMYFHRALDNLFEKKWNFTGLSSALFSILWFWIPAHTITFQLNELYRILFAGILSIVFGLILGLAKKKS